MHPFRFHSRDEGCSYNGFVKDCTIVPLETNDSVLIGEIDKVIFYETRLYVATFSPEQAVYIFNLQGKLLHKISRKGAGQKNICNYPICLSIPEPDLEFIVKNRRKAIGV